MNFDCNLATVYGVSYGGGLAFSKGVVYVGLMWYTSWGGSLPQQVHPGVPKVLPRSHRAATYTHKPQHIDSKGRANGFEPDDH